ncbi:hypothetical protein BDA96_07G102500 [Sorghum bicolor]|uniref:No apical meristem-associated C-terminal domain-containing protein n=2 Tax=Sorghum bicolor TaxID=4558 RepID=A0A921QK37_SORBI|nr:hypothetical protein BDA96_07G102500 [Sorghum bicolor]OQU80217.1 hypothetical protein SORBI_3007G095850 [Sorghum bicolor]
MPLELSSLSPATALALALAPVTATTPAAQASPSSFETYSTWLPPAFVSNYSTPMVQNSDLSAPMQEERQSKHNHKKDTRGSRPAKRMIWTPNETMRLVSAWLKNSNDTVKGNWKRNDQYGGLQLRGSRESDEQVMDNGKAFYEVESDDGEFKLEACWKVLRNQPKWHAYNEDLNGSKKRKYSEAEAVDLTASSDAVSYLQCPIGCKKAKEKLNKKGKGKVSSSIMDEIDKLIEAQENKEAKLLEKEGKKHDKEFRMLETYKALLMTDTSQMHEDMRIEHMLALKGMREMIFPQCASGL